MKKILAGAFILGSFAFASAQTITFKETTIDYGTIKPASDGNKVFTVKNTGDKPLIISKVQPSCGCTTPEWSQEPIMPGKTGLIKVHYDTNRIGDFQKLIEVYSNDPVNSRSTINIKGTVEAGSNTMVQQAANDVKTEAKSVGNAVATGVKKGTKVVKTKTKKVVSALKD